MDDRRLKEGSAVGRYEGGPPEWAGLPLCLYWQHQTHLLCPLARSGRKRGEKVGGSGFMLRVGRSCVMLYGFLFVV